MRLQDGEIDINPGAHYGGVLQTQQVADFLVDEGQPVAVVLRGFTLRYDHVPQDLPNSGDHLLGTANVDLSVQRRMDGAGVDVTCHLAIRDYSRNPGSLPWDDPFSGQVRFTLITN